MKAEPKPPDETNNKDNHFFPPTPLWTSIGILKILDTLIQRDPIDSYRWHQLNNSRDNVITPERLLMIAVLEDGIRCAINGASSREAGESVKRRDRLWVKGFTSDNDDWTFSFGNICDVLKIDAGWLRKGIIKLWKEADKLAYLEKTNHHTGKLWLRSTAKKSAATLKHLENLYRKDQQEIRQTNGETQVSIKSQSETTATAKLL